MSINNGNSNNGNGNGSGNGKHSNNGNGSSQNPAITSVQQLEQLSTETSDIQPRPVNTAPRYIPKFDQPVILRQSRKWSRAILWGLIAVTTGTIIWANFAKIEEAVSATGKLEPTGTVKEIQAPIGGVVKEIYVEDGQQVKLGEHLIGLDPTTANAQLDSLKKIRLSLLRENQFYQSQMRGGSTISATDVQVTNEMLDLTKSRVALVAENRLYRAQLDGTGSSSGLSIEQKERLFSTSEELNARFTAAKLEVDQLSRQLNQSQIKLVSTQDTLKMNQGILDNITPLMNDGAISKIQYFKQQEEVRNAQSEIDQLTQEGFRLQSAINQAQAKLQSTVAISRKDWLTQIADNNKKISEIDSQLTKAIVENNKKIAENDSQLSQTQMNLQYQSINSPVNGTVFELKAHTPGFVVTSSEPILKIVPDDALIAKVYITNKDIGFVKEGMIVDVRIDSFPFSEFGDVKGKLVWIGSDALPPDQIYPFYRFPAKVRLEQQSISINGRKVLLQSGMSVSGNIKLRERTVMSIFTDMFSSSVESLKFVR
ncbi:HlyD family efflux transporter periplasmic adaptor subunit [Nostoc sp. ChiQUE01b]|uniref:HlyD family efflux transporter periplasmic adaptor subunit n=1 Tax=Nostoc sp. ChiQUE01b TaxID=3075376 RepID=UPI002AD3F533|nr:HlyD family efflux transporter periplasmic adaptor subunit [Nostoc sp. ChiQUE01b]MDZ8264544.1 HlyD family efflux transporter periplasmic adaptor subunit [Nostoc sp. ChiQUE01b]